MVSDPRSGSVVNVVTTLSNRVTPKVWRVAARYNMWVPPDWC